LKKIFKILLVVGLILTFNGCVNRAYKNYIFNPFVQATFNSAIIDISEQLLKNSRRKKSKLQITDNISITAFVDLDKLNKTTHFGRKLSESLFNELHTRGFNVIDFRGPKTIKINGQGEFYITRKINLLKDKKIENTYILVGTYTRFGNGTLVNVRLLDNESGLVVSTARTIIDVNDCDLYETCNNQGDIDMSVDRMLEISGAGCTFITCPEKYNRNK